VTTPEEMAQASGTPPTRLVEQDLLDRVLEKEPDRRNAVQRAIEEIQAEVQEGTKSVPRKPIELLRQYVAELDRKLSEGVSAILHDPEVQKLEGSWRGLHQLVQNTQTSPGLKIKMLDASKEELADDLLDADYETTNLWRMIYESEFDTPGGQPFSTVLLDSEFSHHPQDVEMLTQIAAIGGASMCPFITAPSASMFGIDSYQSIAKIRDVSKVFDDRRYANWNSFRESADSCWVTMAMPRVLGRLPYGKATRPVKAFNFEEIPLDSNGNPAPAAHDRFCWSNACYALGQVLTEAYRRDGWCTSIRGRDSGGAVERLPSYTFLNDDGEWDQKCPTEIALTGRMENLLGKLGFMPLSHYKDSDFAVFFGAQSVQKPKKFVNNPDADSNAQISARLPYLMAVSRISHYLKVAGRDWIGRNISSPAELQRELSNWIADYVLDDDQASEQMKAKRPLRAAEIVVEPIPGRPGEFNCIARLMPWLQLEALTASMRVVTKIRRTGG